MITFQEAINQKIEKITKTYDNNLQKVIKYIEDYTTSVVAIDLCANFKEDELNNFPSVDPDNLEFEYRK